MNLLVIKTLTDGTKARTLLNYETENEALSALYYELWYATSNADVVAVVAELIGIVVELATEDLVALVILIKNVHKSCKRKLLFIENIFFDHGQRIRRVGDKAAHHARIVLRGTARGHRSCPLKAG